MFARLFPLLLGVTVVVALRCNKFYRKDYTYLDQFDAFYKLHWDPAGQSWRSAFLACDEEGATLFYPKTADEWVVAKTLVATMEVKPNVTDIFVGIHDEFGLGDFMTVDGLSTPSPLLNKDQEAVGQSACVAMETDTGNYKIESCGAASVKPFVCKKVEEVEPSCPTIDRGYVYNKEASKCFKISKKQMTWTDAMQTCFMEGGVLALITDSNNFRVLSNILLEHSRQRLQHNLEPFFTGFRRLFPNSGFYTVTGHQYDYSYYKIWMGTLEKTVHDDQYDCGVVMIWADNLFTSTRDCMRPARFLCEIEIKA